MHYVFSDIIALTRLFFLLLGAYIGIIVKGVHHQLNKRDEVVFPARFIETHLIVAGE